MTTTNETNTLITAESQYKKSKSDTLINQPTTTNEPNTLTSTKISRQKFKSTTPNSQLTIANETSSHLSTRSQDKKKKFNEKVNSKVVPKKPTQTNLSSLSSAFESIQPAQKNIVRSHPKEVHQSASKSLITKSTSDNRPSVSSFPVSLKVISEECWNFYKT